jgi:hypothetical protein
MNETKPENVDSASQDHTFGAAHELPPPKEAKAQEEPKTGAQLLFQGQFSPQKKRKIVRLEQWIEVRIENGKTITELIPSNENLIRKGQKMWPAPAYVYRRFNFPAGVPDEYAWTCELAPEMREHGGIGLQRMTIADWLEMVAQEKLRTDGHLGPTPDGNLPRPPENGDCDCPVCTHNRTILEERAAAAAAAEEDEFESQNDASG